MGASCSCQHADKEPEAVPIIIDTCSPISLDVKNLIQEKSPKKNNIPKKSASNNITKTSCKGERLLAKDKSRKRLTTIEESKCNGFNLPLTSVVYTPEEEFIQIMNNINILNNDVKKKYEKLGMYKFHMTDTTDGLELVSGVDKGNKGIYYGFV